MELITLNKQTFFEEKVIDAFESAIWTERYYGDGEFELVVPATDYFMNLLPKGQILICPEEGVNEPEPMILQTRDIEDGAMKCVGITLAQWLNNRTIRTSSDHKVREWLITGRPPGEIMIYIVQQMCVGSDYLNGVVNIGIPAAQTALFVVPGLQAVGNDIGSPNVDISVPFGPVFDALKEIATTYEVGQKVKLDGAWDDVYILSYLAYRGTDRSSDQSANPTIRFSSGMETFTNIHDLESIADTKNYIFAFAPNADPAVVTSAGFAGVPTSGPSAVSGFDLRVEQIFIDDTQTDPPPDATALLNNLNQKASNEFTNKAPVQLVDGEIVQTGQIKYGTHYFMGDVVEVEGNTGNLQKARITEYIRSQDVNGERAYPTLSMIDETT
jgi:hypothetical protein